MLGGKRVQWTYWPQNAGWIDSDTGLSADHPGWRIRNVPQPTPQADTKPDLTARAPCMTISEVREMVAKGEDAVIATMLERGYALPEPVDEDLIEAREIAAETVPSWTDAQRTKCRSGEYDGNLFVVHSFAGIKRGRALALAGEKEA